MNVALLTTLDPEGVRNGGTAYTRSLIRIVGRALDVEVDTIPFKETPFDGLGKKLNLARAFAGSFLSRYPAKFHYFRSAAIRRRLLDLAKRDPHVVFFDHLDVAWAETLFPASKKVAIVHNLECFLQQERIGRLGWPGRVLLHPDLLKLRHQEFAHYRRADAVICISEADRRFVVGQLRQDDHKVLTIPPTFTVAAANDSAGMAPPRRRTALAYLGDLSWWPNRLNLEWFVNEVLPRCASFETEFVLNVYGKGSEGIGGRNITGHGFVEDIGVVWKNNDYLIAPTLHGAGLNVKVAEALRSSVPVITTAKAAEAFDPRVQDALIVADGADAWVRTLAALNAPEGHSLWREKAIAVAHLFSPECHVERLRGMLRRTLEIA